MATQIPADELSLKALDDILSARLRGAKTPTITAPARKSSIKAYRPSTQELVAREHEDLEAVIDRLAKIMDSPQWQPVAYSLKTTANYCQSCGHHWITTDGLYLKHRSRRNPADYKLEFVPDSEGLVLQGLQCIAEHSTRVLPACHRCWPERGRGFIRSCNNDL